MLLQKDGVALEFDESHQIIAMISVDIEKLLDTFKNVEQMLLSEINSNHINKIFFYEFLIRFIVKSNNSPLKVISNTKRLYPFYEQMTNLLGSEVTPFNLRFSSPNSIESHDWFDLNIEPLLSSANNRYFINYIIRNNQFDVVQEKMKNSFNIVSKAIDIIENKNLPKDIDRAENSVNIASDNVITG
jgi:hypothetical protein